jgi:hypothetical protein
MQRWALVVSRVTKLKLGPGPDPRRSSWEKHLAFATKIDKGDGNHSMFVSSLLYDPMPDRHAWL